MTEIIHNTTMKEALERQDKISKLLRGINDRTYNSTPTTKELEDAGIKLEKYTEPIGYPRDRNMI